MLIGERAAFIVDAETFNNCFGFERGLWLRHTRCVAVFQKRGFLEGDK